jgi:hypothetical protein
VPLSHRGKSKVGANNKIKFYQAVNMLTCFENFQHLAEILEKRVPWEHHREHRRQGLSAAINSLSNMLSMILQQHHDATTVNLSPKSVCI